MLNSVWDLAIICTIALVVTYRPTDAENARKKDRDVSGLYPFPRVGRQPPSINSRIQEFIKREGLIPFPRVGRGESEFPPTREGQGIKTFGLWFGPRHGRSSKSDWIALPVPDPFEKDVIRTTLNLEPGNLYGEDVEVKFGAT